MRDLVERIADVWSQEGLSRKAAALAYYTIFAFSPLVVIAGSVATWVFGTSAADQAIEERLAETFGPEVAADLLASLTQSVDSSAGAIATIVAIGVLIYGAGRLLYQMQRIFDDLLGVRIREGTPWLTVALRRLVPFLLVTTSGIVVAAAILMQAAVSWLRSTWLVEELPFHVPEGVSQLTATFVFSLLIIGALYRLLPDGRLRVRYLMLGAAVAAAAYTIGQRVFFWYVSWGGAQTLSGVAGTIVLFLVWIHFTMTAVLGGLILARAWAETHGEEVVPATYAVRVTRVVEDAGEDGDPSAGSSGDGADPSADPVPSDASV